MSFRAAVYGGQKKPAANLSKTLTWLLRHGAEKEGFAFLPGGFLYVDEILQNPQFINCTISDVKTIATNDKERFHLEMEKKTGRLKIRANYGHSLQGQKDGTPNAKLARSLTWLLRHGAEKEGFAFLPGGFLYVDQILQNTRFSDYTIKDVKIMATSDKQRFHLEMEKETGRLKIRANHGHSLQVSDLDLEPITNADQFPVVLHGTYYKFWDSIRRQGLMKKRAHIHFSTETPGLWKSCDLFIYLDLGKAMAGGLSFFHTGENVILCEGNQDGVISTEFFKRVVDRKTGAEIDMTAPVGLQSPEGRVKGLQIQGKSWGFWTQRGK